MVRNVIGYIHNRERVLGLGPSRERVSKMNWVPELKVDQVGLSHLELGMKFRVGEGYEKISSGVGEIREVRRDGLIVFEDSTGKKIILADNSPLLKPENLVE